MKVAKLFQIHSTKMNEIFQSNRYFILFDIIASHGQLLLRSQKTEENALNIDIVFYDTTFIQLFSRLSSVRISIVSKDVKDFNYESVKKYLDHSDTHLFQIESNNEKYHIAASFLRVYENQMEFSESSLHAIDKGEEIASSLSD